MRVLYTRVSTGRQEKEETIERQKYECRQKTQEDGDTVGGEYADDGYTGSTLMRPGLDKLRADCRAGLVKAVLMHAPDRLARDKFLRQLVLREWKELGIEVLYHHYKVEDTPEGRLLDDLLGSFAEFEREVIRERTRSGRERALRDGAVWRAKSPFGFRYVKVHGGGSMEIVEEQVATVRQIFAWLLDGHSLYWVRAELNARGIVTAYGTPWSYAVLDRMIKNPIYSGTVVHNRYRGAPVKRPRSEFRKVMNGNLIERPQEEWHCVTPLADDGTRALAIVSAETQERAIAQLATNSRLSSRNAKRVYTLSGLLFCSEAVPGSGTPCGYRLGGCKPRLRAGQDAATYRCQRNNGDGHDSRYCSGKIDATLAESTLWSWVVSQISDPDVLRRHLHIKDSGVSQRRKDAETLVGHIGSNLDAIQKKLAVLIDLLVDKEIDRATLLTRQAMLVAERGRLQNGLHTAKKDLAVLSPDHTWNAEAFSKYVKDSLRTIESLPDESRRLKQQELLRRVVQRIDVHKDRLEITGQFASTLPIVNPSSGASDHNVVTARWVVDLQPKLHLRCRNTAF